MMTFVIRFMIQIGATLLQGLQLIARMPLVLINRVAVPLLLPDRQHVMIGQLILRLSGK